MENKFFKVGDFCLNQDCPDYGVLQKNKSKPNIKKFGSAKAGRQRYQCKTCGKTFTERKGTIFYRKKHSEKEIMEALAMIAEGSRISSVSRIKGYKEDTISSWIQQAALHAAKIEEVLLKEHKIQRGQLDGLWAYVKNRGEKKLS